MNRAGRTLLLLLLFAGLIIAVTWPWARSFSSGFLVHWDPPFHAWKLNLVAESILHGRVFPPERTSNVFFPSSLTLYYEALHWPQAVLAAGLRLFTDNVVLVYHLVFVAFWAFSGLCFFWLLRELATTAGGAVLGAALFVILPLRVSYRFEFNMQLCAGLVLFLLFLFRFLRAPGALNALGVSLGFWFQAASELYLALILVLVLPLLVAPSLRRAPLRGLGWRAWSGIGAGLLAGGALTWYFLWPYLALKQQMHFSRGIEEMRRHFLDPLAYLLTPGMHSLLPWVQRVRRDEFSAYPGAVVLAGMLAYAVSSRSLFRPAAGGGRPEHSLLRILRGARLAALLLLAFAFSVVLPLLPPGGGAWLGHPVNALLLLVLATSVVVPLVKNDVDPAARARSGLAAAAVLAFTLSLGPDISVMASGWSTTNRIFTAVYHHLPLLSGMRVVSRFAIVALISLLVLAVAGWDALCRRRPRLRWAAVPLLLAAMLEARVPAVATQPFSAPWRTPALAALERDPEAPLLVIPFGDRDWDSQYMLGIAGTSRRLLYGWGGFYPPFQGALHQALLSEDNAGLIAMLGRVYPPPFVLLDRQNLARHGWPRGNLLEGFLARSCEPVAADERFALFRVRPPTSAAASHLRITRHDVLAAEPVAVFSGRSATGGEVAATVTVNGIGIGRFAAAVDSVRHAIRIPPAALERIRPNEIRIDADGALALESFALVAPGQVPPDAREIDATR